MTEAVGTHLKQILESCGVKAPEGCPCIEWMKEMDNGGVDWCIIHRESIINRLNEAARKRRWMEWKMVASKGYLSTSSLLDEAIRRAKAAT